MSIGTSVEGNRDNARFTVCLDESKNSLTNDEDSNQDLLLAASLQFLHRLLAQRTFQYNSKPDSNEVTIPRIQTQDIMQKGNNTSRESNCQLIRQIQEYKRQLWRMENFLSTMCNNTEDCDATVLDKTDDIEDEQNLSFVQNERNTCGLISQNPFTVISDYKYSYHNESSVDISERVNEIDVPVMEGLPRATLTPIPSKARSIVPIWNSLKNDGIQRSASYADVVRNAVSGLARNCRKKQRSRRKKHVANSWLPPATKLESPKEGKRQSEYQSEVESEMSSKSQFHDRSSSDISREIPLRVQLAMEDDASPRKPVTLLVRVQSNVFNLLNRKVSDTRISITHSSESRGGPSIGKRKRITSVFRNFLKGKNTPSSTIVKSKKEKLPSRVSLASEETNVDAEDQTNDTSRNTLIYTLQKSASCDLFDRKRTEKKAKKSENTKSRISSGNTWRKVAEGRELHEEVAESNGVGIVTDLINYCDEKIIPLRYSEGSSQLGNERIISSEISDVDMFLKLAKEMRKSQVCRDANEEHVEIPVEIKTMESPLRLRETPNISEGFFNHRVFQPAKKISQTTPNGFGTQQFLEMIVGTLPQSAYLSQAESLKLSSHLEPVENGSQNNFQPSRNGEDSALEVLLRHIATDTSMTPYVEPYYAAEKDTSVQNVPRRQLSKMSVCYSSESLSGSEHETPEVRVKNFKVNPTGECESKISSNQQYSHDHQTVAEQEVAIHDYSGDIYAGVKIRTCLGIQRVNENEDLNHNASPFNIQNQGNLVRQTEVIIEERDNGTIEAELKTEAVMTEGEEALMPVRETEKTIFCHPVLSRQIFGDRKEVADAMIRWWGPQITYSTTPTSQTQLSNYSVSINNFI